MPGKIASYADAYKSVRSLPPPSPEPPDLLDEAKPHELLQQKDKLLEQLGVAWDRFEELLDRLHLDLQSKEAVVASVQKMTNLLSKLSVVRFKVDADISERLSSRLEKHAKGPRLKHERIEQRHEAIAKAIEVGIRGDEDIFRFMKENHADLIRKCKKDFISIKQMMNFYRKSKGQ